MTKPKAKKRSKKPVSGKAAKPSTKPKAPERPYPRVLLEKALIIPQTLKDKNGGNAWPPDEMANAVGLAKTNNDFFYLAAASRDFGLTEGTRSKDFSLTELGRTLVYAPDPETERESKLRAFLNVEIFRKVLNYYRGSNLPDMQYLGNTLQNNFGLDPSTHEEFSRLFRGNCKYLDIGEGFNSGDPATAGEKDERESEYSEGHSPVITLVEAAAEGAPLCFVIMPFKERTEEKSKGFFDEVLRSLIVPAGSTAGFQVKTANRKGSDVIQSTIINDLLKADLVLADLTEHNPNVLFELGMRMAEDKPVALIRSKGTSAIFDVDNMLRVFEYSPNLWPSTIKDDLPNLAEHIKATWDNRSNSQTYVKILRGTKK